MIVCKRASFDAAHWLPGYEGKCAAMHGHHWVVELGIEGEVGDGGMVIDFSKLKELLEKVTSVFDHKVVNDAIENPTAENIVRYIKNLASEALESYLEDRYGKFGHHFSVELAFVRVWETEDSYAEWRP